MVNRMSVFSSDMFESTEPRKCDYCGELVYKWINVIPGGDFCINCAQMTMRILFEDIIEFHNNHHISLLKVMHHGDPRK